MDQFTGKGKLKKNAKTEYKTELEKYDPEVMGRYIKYLGYSDFQSPYVFTHIKAKSPYQGQAVIYQEVMVGGSYLITSPTKLLEALKK